MANTQAIPRARGWGWSGSCSPERGCGLLNAEIGLQQALDLIPRLAKAFKIAILG